MKDYSKITLIFLLAFLPYLVKAQNHFSGLVSAENNKKPIKGAQLNIYDLKISAYTDSAGKFNFKDLPVGEYLIEVSSDGYSNFIEKVFINGNTTKNFLLANQGVVLNEVVVTGLSSATDQQKNPVPITVVSNTSLQQNSATNVIDAISKVPGVSAITDGQSISKPVIRGLGYNRVLTINDGVEQIDQPWFDEFGIEADPNAVNRFEILKGPASLAYGSDAIAGVINLIPEAPKPEGQVNGELLFNYQTNNGLINNMLYIGGTNNGISWSARVDNSKAHAYTNPVDGYVLNSQFSNFNTDATIGLYQKWGYTQLHASYFDMETGIVDGTRDSVSGTLVRPVAYPGLNNGEPTYVLPTQQEKTSYTPFVINQHIRHTKIVWDNSIALGSGRLKAIFSYQKNQRQENNDPTEPDVSDIYYSSNGATYNVQYILPTTSGFKLSEGVNGVYQSSESLGTLLLIPNYSFFEIGGFSTVEKQYGKLNLIGGLRYDTRTFTGADHWVDSTNQAPVAPNAVNAIHEFNGFTSHFNGTSFSFGGAYNFNKALFVKANIAQGWRAPNVAESAANGVHDGTVVYEIGDSKLQPETNLEEDISFGANTRNFDFELNLFNNHIDHFIYAQGLKTASGADSINNSLNAVGLGAAPVYKYKQGAAQLYGGELMFNLHPKATPWVELSTTVSVVAGGLLNVADSTKYLPFVPPTRITANLKFPFTNLKGPISNAYLKFGMLDCFDQSNIYRQYAIYNGLNTALTPFEYAASNSATKGYVLFDAGAGGDININGKVVCKLYIVCNNLFNTAYIDYMSRFKYYPVNYTTHRVGVYNMGRNISFKLIVPLDFTGNRRG
jgi:iron complex outermembrane receptor protein